VDAILKLSLKDRRLACLQVEDAMRLQAASVEKDFWVCWTLRELTSLPDLGAGITFKGGTSLSKAWKLIERFSEDIDIIVDKKLLGFGGDAAPDRAPSGKQRKKRLDALIDACRRWVQDRLRPALHARIADRLGPFRQRRHVEARGRSRRRRRPVPAFSLPQRFPRQRSRLRAAHRED